MRIDTTTMLGREIGQAWGMAVRRATPLTGGWNSGIWLVETADGRYVAKLADHDDAGQFADGLRVARFLASHGFASGSPRPTRDGHLAVPLPAGMLALLAHVPGRPPRLREAGEVRRAGQTLARAHRLLAGCPLAPSPRSVWPWPWVRRCLDTIPMPAAVNQTARRVWDEIVAAVADAPPPGGGDAFGGCSDCSDQRRPQPLPQREQRVRYAVVTAARHAAVAASRARRRRALQDLQQVADERGFDFGRYDELDR
jgi:hypothetical protein